MQPNWESSIMLLFFEALLASPVTNDFPRVSVISPLSSVGEVTSSLESQGAAKQWERIAPKEINLTQVLQYEQVSVLPENT